MKGVFGLYVGYEHWTDESDTFTRAWFKELTPPWREGGGLRIRFGHRAIQIGRYHRNTEEDMNALKVLGGRELPMFDPEEIGGWHGQGVQTQGEGPADPAA